MSSGCKQTSEHWSLLLDQTKLKIRAASNLHWFLHLLVSDFLVYKISENGEQNHLIYG